MMNKKEQKIMNLIVEAHNEFIFIVLDSKDKVHPPDLEDMVYSLHLHRMQRELIIRAYKRGCKNE